MREGDEDIDTTTRREEKRRGGRYISQKFGPTRRHCEAYKHSVRIHIAFSFFLPSGVKDGQRPRGVEHIDEPRTGLQRPKSRNIHYVSRESVFRRERCKGLQKCTVVFLLSPHTMSFIVRELTSLFVDDVDVSNSRYIV